MSRKKIIKRFFAILLLVIVIAGTIYAWKAFPIISGYAAKNMASAIYLQHREKDKVMKEDLGFFPLSLASVSVDFEDSSVTASVWGFAKKKAIYRSGLGCTLINEADEQQLRSVRRRQESRPSYLDTMQWPRGDKLPDSIDARVNKAKLDQVVDSAMSLTHDGQPAYTRAIMVLYDGQIVAERYAPGFDQHTVMLGWSISKSMIGAMIGILVKDGKLNVDQPAPVEEWQGTNKQQITIKNLLQQTSGIKFRENYSGPSEVTNMLFRHGDMAAYTARLAKQYDAGTRFNYSSGNSNILSRIIRRSVGEQAYLDFPDQALFHRIGIYSMILEPDASGTYIGSSYSYATARDFARFGLLYYHDGNWFGDQVLPVNWVKETVQPSSADPAAHYGYQFWLNGKDPKDLSKRWYPDLPPDMYFADGYGGQDIYIIPSKKLIVLRFGLKTIDENLFLKNIIEVWK